MRVSLASLPPALDDALAQRLSDGGHEVADAGADGLVAGVGPLPAPARVLDMTQEDWEATVAAARTAFEAVRERAADLLTRGARGRIVVVIAPPALRVAEGAAAQAVAGAFMTTLSQVAAAELGGGGTTVNVVAAWAGDAPADAGALAEATPLGRVAEPDEIAAVCAFLLSEEASFVTGAVLAADGGWQITKAGGGSPFLASAGR